MDFSNLFNWLMGVTDWIERVLINGLLGAGFGVLMKVLFAIVDFGPAILAILSRLLGT